jgi:hypothetical protein
VGKRKICKHCGELGHNVRTCEKRQREVGRAMAAIQVKNPLHWERLKATRMTVQEHLYAALDNLSDKAPAVKDINAALEALEGCR